MPIQTSDSPMQRYIQETLAEAFPGDPVTITDTTGGGDHFQVEIVSERFAGMNPIQQHRLVYEALGDKVGNQIHALGLRTRTPDPS